jgi:hypothetical protein
MAILLGLWIFWSALFVATGWLASEFGVLSRITYAVVCAIGIICTAAFLVAVRMRWRLPRARFYKWLPLSFLLLACLALIGGVVHPPNNYDALSYRLPRLLRWLAAGKWHWIVTYDQRMNYMGANAEWLDAPLMVLTQSDRLLFVVNFIPFLFLPSLVFSVYRMLGVAGRVAYYWMWVLPAGYCFALQAASLGNDSISGILILASVYFALLSRKRNQIICVALGIIALALATGIKASNLPLGLPCVLALAPSYQFLFKRKLAALSIVAVSILISFAPIAILNYFHTGSWIGAAETHDKLRAGTPLAGFIGNSLHLGAQMAQPPILPHAQFLSTKIPLVLPKRILAMVHANYADFHPSLKELPQEEGAGLGLGISLLVLVIVIGMMTHRNRSRSSQSRRFGPLIVTAVWLAFFVYMCKVASSGTARLLAPYYPLMLPAFLFHSVNDYLTRQRWWQILVGGCVAGTLIAVLLTPSRPLFPSQRLFAALKKKSELQPSLSRATDVYTVYAQRNDVLGVLRDCLPSDVREVGFLGEQDDSDYSMFRPWGSRQVDLLTGTASWQKETEGLSWIVGKSRLLPERYGKSLDQISAEAGGRVIKRQFIVLKITQGPEEWFVMRLENHKMRSF